jgi:Mg-chelatase subunit ChlD
MDRAALAEALADDEGAPYRVSIVLLVDGSGSMKPFATTVPDAIEGFVTKLRDAERPERSRLAVVTFAERGEVALGFQPLSAELRLREYAPEGGTRLVDTVRDVLLVLLERRWDEDERVVVAVLTDGRDTAGTPDSRWEVQALALRARAKAWTLLTFGIGTDARHAARGLGFPDDAESAQTLARSAGSLHESLAYVAYRSIPPGGSGVVPRS